RRVLALHQIGVVGDHAERDAEARKLAVGILVLGRIVFRHVLRNVGREPAVALPHDHVRGIRGVDDVDRMDAARIFLADALEHALRAGTPGYLASKALPTFSDSGRSTEVYQTTLPSFFAASISAGVTASAAGAADTTRVDSAAVASAVEPCRSLRRVRLGIVVSLSIA